MSFEYFETVGWREMLYDGREHTGLRKPGVVPWHDLFSMKRCHYQDQTGHLLSIVFLDSICNQLIILPLPTESYSTPSSPSLIVLNKKIMDVSSAQYMDWLGTINQQGIFIIVSTTQIFHCTLRNSNSKQPLDCIILSKYKLFEDTAHAHHHLMNIQALSHRCLQHHFVMVGMDLKYRLFLYVYHVGADLQVTCDRRQLTMPQAMNKYECLFRLSPLAGCSQAGCALGQVVLHGACVEKEEMPVCGYEVRVGLHGRLEVLEKEGQKMEWLHQYSHVVAIYGVGGGEESCYVSLYQRYRKGRQPEGINGGNSLNKEQNNNMEEGESVNVNMEEGESVNVNMEEGESVSKTDNGDRLLEDSPKSGGESYIWAFRSHTRALVQIPGTILCSSISTGQKTILSVLSCTKKAIRHGSARDPPPRHNTKYCMTYMLLEGLYYECFTMRIREGEEEMCLLGETETAMVWMDRRGRVWRSGKIGKRILYLKMCEMRGLGDSLSTEVVGLLTSGGEGPYDG